MNVRVIQAAVARAAGVERRITDALEAGTYTTAWAFEQLTDFARSVANLPPGERYYASRALNQWAANLPSDEPDEIAAWLEHHQEIRAMWDEARLEAQQARKEADDGTD